MNFYYKNAYKKAMVINEGKIAKFCAKHPKLCKGGKIVGGALALGGVAYGAKKGYDKFSKPEETPADYGF